MGSRETFTGAVVVVVLAMVAAGEKAGVSAAMGAFAAGIVLGESDHVHEVAATLAPLHDLLSSLFFVSVGMLLVPSFLVAHPLEVGACVAALVVLKTAAAFVALRGAGTVPRTALRASLALANVGEFSFVLATTGASLALLSGDARQLVGRGDRRDARPRAVPRRGRAAARDAPSGARGRVPRGERGGLAAEGAHRRRRRRA